MEYQTFHSHVWLHTFSWLGIKPDFHSHLSPVTSEIFCICTCKLVKPTESEEKISFTLFTFEVQIFQMEKWHQWQSKGVSGNQASEQFEYSDIIRKRNPCIPNIYLLNSNSQQQSDQLVPGHLQKHTLANGSLENLKKLPPNFE